MEFLIRFSQNYESFQRPEIEALAIVEQVELTVLSYDSDSPFCIVKLPSIEAAQKLIRRSILAQSIHELWGQGGDLEDLKDSAISRSSWLWPKYGSSSFKINIDNYRGNPATSKRLETINFFSFIPLKGPIMLKAPEETFTCFELWPFQSFELGITRPDYRYFGRLVGGSSRDIIKKYDLKKRGWISTTSMDSELALVTANIALAAAGKLFYDPFVGTGSFPVACAHFGAMAWGSDLDGRSIRGEGGKKSLKGNFEQYGIQARLGDMFSTDLTHHPFSRERRIWDGIICDPPYGVREGLKVLGVKDPEKTPWLIEAGRTQGMLPDYIPPKKPYSFIAMLDDILIYASETLVDGGRLSFWMPTANDEDQELPIPTHPCLDVVVVCVQAFYKWSRRLITYRRLPNSEVSSVALEVYAARERPDLSGITADDLNPFRKGYFRKFEADE